MNSINGYKTYILSTIGAGVTSGFGLNGMLPPAWSTLITIGWFALMAIRHGQKTDKEKQAITIAKFIAAEMNSLLNGAALPKSVTPPVSPVLPQSVVITMSDGTTKTVNITDARDEVLALLNK